MSGISSSSASRAASARAAVAALRARTADGPSAIAAAAASSTRLSEALSSGGDEAAADAKERTASAAAAAAAASTASEIISSEHHARMRLAVAHALPRVCAIAKGSAAAAAKEASKELAEFPEARLGAALLAARAGHLSTALVELHCALATPAHPLASPTAAMQAWLARGRVFAALGCAAGAELFSAHVDRAKAIAAADGHVEALDDEFAADESILSICPLSLDFPSMDHHCPPRQDSICQHDDNERDVRAENASWPPKSLTEGLFRDAMALCSSSAPGDDGQKLAHNCRHSNDSKCSGQGNDGGNIDNDPPLPVAQHLLACKGEAVAYLARWSMTVAKKRTVRRWWVDCSGVEEQCQWSAGEGLRLALVWPDASASAALAEELADEARWLRAEGFHRSSWVKCVAAAAAAARSGVGADGNVEAASMGALPAFPRDLGAALQTVVICSKCWGSAPLSAAVFLLDAAACAASLPDAPRFQIVGAASTLPAVQAAALAALQALRAGPVPVLAVSDAWQEAALRAAHWLAAASVGALIAGTPLLRRSAPTNVNVVDVNADGALVAASLLSWASSACALATAETEAMLSAAMPTSGLRKRLAAMSTALPMPRGVTEAASAPPVKLTAAERAICWRELLS